MLTGIDAITYGVEDMALCRKFLSDWGLRKASSTKHSTRFETLDGTEVCLRPHDAKLLPPAMESGSTLREVVWGVKGKRNLDALIKQITGNPSFTEGKDGLVRITDPNGLSLSFRLTQRKSVTVTGAAMNTPGSPNRLDAPSPVYERAIPIHVGHVVLFVPDLAEAESFYTEMLGFQVSDRYPQHGTFLRCALRGGHHNLFLLKSPTGKSKLNHVAFTVRDIHEVFGGGLHISRQGWKTQLGPGRHPISSAYFWYVHSPCGGLAEYYADEDFLTEDWQPRRFERKSELFAEWAVSGGLDGNTRRQHKGAF
jgi:catechol 2,3-dioxygenase-like lactoylglutathione lyase family enzyme